MQRRNIPHRYNIINHSSSSSTTTDPPLAPAAGQQPQQQLQVARSKRGREKSQSPPGGEGEKGGGVASLLSAELRETLGIDKPALVVTSGSSAVGGAASSKRKGTTTTTNGSTSTTTTHQTSVPWDAEEDFRLLEEVMCHGPKWTLISRMHQPPRSANMLKHRWTLVESLLIRAKESSSANNDGNPLAADGSAARGLAQHMVPLKEILVDWHSNHTATNGKMIRSEVMQRVNLLTGRGGGSGAAGSGKNSSTRKPTTSHYSDADSVAGGSSSSAGLTLSGASTATTISVQPPPSSGPRVIGSVRRGSQQSSTQYGGGGGMTSITSPSSLAVSEEEENNTRRLQIMRMMNQQHSVVAENETAPSIAPSVREEMSELNDSSPSSVEVEKVLNDLVSGDIAHLLPSDGESQSPSSMQQNQSSTTINHHTTAGNEINLLNPPHPILDDQNLLEMDCPVPASEANTTTTDVGRGPAVTTTESSSSIEPLLSVLDEADSSSTTLLHQPAATHQATKSQEEVNAVVARSVHQVVEDTTMQTAGTILGTRDPVSEEIMMSEVGTADTSSSSPLVAAEAVVASAVISDTTTTATAAPGRQAIPTSPLNSSFSDGVVPSSSANSSSIGGGGVQQTAFMAAWLNLQNSGMSFSNPVWSSVSEQTLQQQMMASVTSSSASTAASSASSSPSSVAGSSSSSSAPSSPAPSSSPVAAASTTAAASGSKSVKSMLPRLAAWFPLPYLYSIGTQFSSLLPSAATLPLPSTIAINAAASPPFGAAVTGSSGRRGRNSNSKRVNHQVYPHQDDLLVDNTTNLGSSNRNGAPGGVGSGKDLGEADILLSESLQNDSKTAPVQDTLASTKSIGRTFCPVAMFKTISGFIFPQQPQQAS